jgi:S1-C subfamily serine protease
MSPVKRASLLGFVSALVGGAVVALLLVGFDLVGSDQTKTVVQQGPIAKSNVEGTSRGLTARDIYKRDAPGVVYIRAEIVQQTQSPFDFGPTTQRGVATGSGFVIDKQGNILTNAHVVEGASKITVSMGNKETVPARVSGRDVSNDLALIKVDPKGLNLKPLALGDADSVQVGDPTIAIGNPFGLDRTLTTGVVSALQRKIQAPNGFTISNVIQTDAAINPGNSGGPLLDAAGRVIGINSQIETGGNGSGNVGIGFAVPIDTAKKALPQLEKGNVERGFLGITGATIKPSMNLAVKQGVIVQSVDPGSGADKAGIEGAQSTSPDQPSTGGDIITKVNGKAITGIGQLRSAVGNKKPGDKVTLTVLHGGQTKDVTVTLGASPTTVTSDQGGGQSPQPIP